MGVEAFEFPVGQKRIDRKDDENLYQPKIHSTWNRQLYAIGQQIHLPLTIIIDQAIEEYIKQLNASTNERTSNFNWNQ